MSNNQALEEAELKEKSMNNISHANEILSKLSVESTIPDAVPEIDTYLAGIRMISSQTLWKSQEVANMTDIHVINATKYIRRETGKFKQFEKCYYAFIIEIEYRKIGNMANFDYKKSLKPATDYWDPLQKRTDVEVHKPLDAKPSPRNSNQSKPNWGPFCVIKCGNRTISSAHCLPVFDSVVLNNTEYIVDEIVYNLNDQEYEIFVTER